MHLEKYFEMTMSKSYAGIMQPHDIMCLNLPLKCVML